MILKLITSLMLVSFNLYGGPIELWYESSDYLMEARNAIKVNLNIPDSLISQKYVDRCGFEKTMSILRLCLNKKSDLLVLNQKTKIINGAYKIFRDLKERNI